MRFNGEVIKRILTALAVSLLSVGGAASVQVLSTGPILLRYADTVLPTGVCKLMECEFQKSITKGPLKDYYYTGVYGNLVVTRDPAKRITAGQYSSMSWNSGARAEVIKFARGFAGVNLTDRNLSDCLNGLTLRGRAASGFNFEFSCAARNGQTTVKVVDQSAAMRASATVKPANPSGNSAPTMLRVIDQNNRLGCMNKEQLQNLIRMAVSGSDLASAYVVGAIDRRECRAFRKGERVTLVKVGMLSTLWQARAADTGVVYWFPREAVSERP